MCYSVRKIVGICSPDCIVRSTKYAAKTVFKMHKNVAVVFITKLDNNEPVNEGLCLKCARELGIKPVQDMMDRMGISEEDLEGLTSEMMSAFGGPEALRN